MNLQIKGRFYIIASALMALFLGALDTLIMSAAMPSIVADLGGLDLYSWVFSAYLLSRAVSLPIFGKLADLFKTKNLFLFSVAMFILSSLLAGVSVSMTQLIVARVVQGIGAGGCFALVTIVLSEVSTPEKRGKMLSLGSFVWGLASVLGPPIGGFIVYYFSWQWIFYMNIPLGSISFLGICLYFKETRQKRSDVSIDGWGITTLSVTILSLLTAFLLTGQGTPWHSLKIIGLFVLTVLTGIGFFYVEKRAKEPVLPVEFFSVRGFKIGNCAVFFSSFAVFSIVAYSPLFIQGALGETPVQLGMVMLALSLAWSAGALICGQVAHRIGSKPNAIGGAFLILFGSAMALAFTASTPLIFCYIALSLAGMGMGFSSISTLLVVQSSLEEKDLGVATSSQQFARTLGGTIGVGVTGSIAIGRITEGMDRFITSGATGSVSMDLIHRIRGNVENLFQSDVQSLIPAPVLLPLREIVSSGIWIVFLFALMASILSLILSFRLPGKKEEYNKG
ncbi:MAG TPA: MFS transporter [Deltaproteobacteria bacterium]|nr:MFS transporter [Deltaproteobacteria bacterium]